MRCWTDRPALPLPYRPVMSSYRQSPMRVKLAAFLSDLGVRIVEDGVRGGGSGVWPGASHGDLFDVGACVLGSTLSVSMSPHLVVPTPLPTDVELRLRTLAEAGPVAVRLGEDRRVTFLLRDRVCGDALAERLGEAFGRCSRVSEALTSHVLRPFVERANQAPWSRPRPAGPFRREVVPLGVVVRALPVVLN